jgi:hypothetical protein
LMPEAARGVPQETGRVNYCTCLRQGRNRSARKCLVLWRKYEVNLSHIETNCVQRAPKCVQRPQRAPKCALRAPSEAASILRLGLIKATATATGHKEAMGHTEATCRKEAVPLPNTGTGRHQEPFNTGMGTTWDRCDWVRSNGRPIWAAVLWASPYGHHAPQYPSTCYGSACEPCSSSSALWTSAADFAWIGVSAGHWLL